MSLPFILNRAESFCNSLLQIRFVYGVLPRAILIQLVVNGLRFLFQLGKSDLRLRCGKPAARLIYGSGRSVARLARLLGVQEVGSSNLPAPTIYLNIIEALTKIYPPSIMRIDAS